MAMAYVFLPVHWPSMSTGRRKQMFHGIRNGNWISEMIAGLLASHTLVWHWEISAPYNLDFLPGAVIGGMCAGAPC